MRVINRVQHRSKTACAFRYLFLLCLTIPGSRTFSQYPTSCASVSSRANSNGQTTQCPNVSGTAYAANFTGTSYATVPVTAKTGNLTLKYTGATSSLKPFAITKVWQTNPSTTLLAISFGPASPPAVSGSDILVSYCFYNNNMPTLGTVSLQFTNPETGVVSGICSFDASCNSNCNAVANPAAVPITLTSFQAMQTGDAVRLEWVTAQEINNKGFDVERSIDDSAFTSIHFIPSAYSQGNGSQPAGYAYTDNTLPAGAILRYRLRQIDLDGHFSFSPEAVVRLNRKNSPVQIAGAAHQIILSFGPGIAGSTCFVSVYDAQGRLLHARHINASGRYIINGLQNGSKLCYVHVTGGNPGLDCTKAVYVK